VLADMQGLASEGVARVPGYIDAIRRGHADAAAEPAILVHRGAVCLVDARDPVAAYEACSLAVNEAIERARKHGVGFASVTNSSDCGALVNCLLPVAAAGMVGIGFANSPAAALAEEETRAFCGESPIAAVFPRRESDPIVIDLSLASTDGAAATMLVLMVELMVCSLAGAAFGFEAAQTGSDRPRTGQAFLAVDPAALAGRGSYYSRVETLVTALLGDPEARLPGERRQRSYDAAALAGIDIPDALQRQLHELARR